MRILDYFKLDTHSEIAINKKFLNLVKRVNISNNVIIKSYRARGNELTLFAERDFFEFNILNDILTLQIHGTIHKL